MGDVYDFKTGRLCKRCEVCRWWKDAQLDFEPNPTGKYGSSDICMDCAENANKFQKELQDMVNIPDEVA